MNCNNADLKGEINRTQKRAHEYLGNGTFTFQCYFVIFSASI